MGPCEPIWIVYHLMLFLYDMIKNYIYLVFTLFLHGRMCFCFYMCFEFDFFTHLENSFYIFFKSRSENCQGSFCTSSGPEIRLIMQIWLSNNFIDTRKNSFFIWISYCYVLGISQLGPQLIPGGPWTSLRGYERHWALRKCSLECLGPYTPTS